MISETLTMFRMCKRIVVVELSFNTGIVVIDTELHGELDDPCFFSLFVFPFVVVNASFSFNARLVHNNRFSCTCTTVGRQLKKAMAKLTNDNRGKKNEPCTRIKTIAKTTATFCHEMLLNMMSRNLQMPLNNLMEKKFAIDCGCVFILWILYAYKRNCNVFSLKKKKE